jgi:hypothetical protein
MAYCILGTDAKFFYSIQVDQSERRQGTYVIGATGTGKSTLFENLIVQDIEQGIGVGLLDPHGDLVDRVIERMCASVQRLDDPKIGKAERRLCERIQERLYQDVILLDIANIEQVFGLNLFECSAFDSRSVQQRVDQVLHIFDLIYNVTRENYTISQTIRNASHTIIANRLTLAEIPFLLTNRDYRDRLLQQVKHQPTIEYWQRFEQKNKQDRDREIEATLNKLDELLQPLTLNIIGQAKSTISLGEIMDERKILLVKLDARMPYMTSLIGSILIANMLNAAYDRQAVLPKDRKQFNLYADEFQRFATPDFAVLLTEARKYGIATTIAHQTREQLDRENKATSLQAANLIVFRVTGIDAEELATQFDATPQVAWEEEMQPEWFERVEEEVIDGEEEIKTPVKDIIHHLLNGGSHPNDVVNRFTHEILPKMEPFKNTYNSPLDALNQFLYKSMIGIPTTREDIQAFIVDLCWACEMYAFWYHLNDSLISLSSPVPIQSTHLHIYTPELINEFHTYWKTGNSNSLYQLMYQRIRADIFNDLRAELLHWETTLELWHMDVKKRRENLDGWIPIAEILAAPSITASPLIIPSYSHGYTWTRHLTPFSSWFSINLLQLEWQQVNEPFWSDQMYKMLDHEKWKLLPKQEWKCYRQADFDAAVNHVYWDQRNKSDELVTFLKQTIQALANDPIKENSGLTQPRKRTQINYHTHPRKTISHPQRSYSDRQGEVANRLASLPNMTAYVRLSSGEHQVTIERSNQGISRTALNQYIIDIVDNNIIVGYLRHYEDVEREIAKRQQPPQAPVPKPPATPPASPASSGVLPPMPLPALPPLSPQKKSRKN